MPTKNKGVSHQLGQSPEVSKRLIGQLDDQIRAFEETIAAVSKYQSVEDEGYQRAIDFDTWITERRDKYDFGAMPR